LVLAAPSGKPIDTPCPNCAERGCKIYPLRPNQCRAYECGWKLYDFPEFLKPNTCGFVITIEPTGTIVLHTDGTDSWRRPKTLRYFGGLALHTPVLVRDGKDVYQ